MEEEEEEEEEEQEEEQEEREQEEEVKACFKALNEFLAIQQNSLSFYGGPLLPLSYERFSPGDEYSSFAY
ncbi:hypothetical protein HZH68_012594 [Vespula germanica]|uniref:Uncharacterized protein n=1 Tax=Vespula germanica TaxID=30212 RepID=A0A834MXD5_VESGE|nr:hypothetical protein HZH68_012594 [Vespula germanica]